MVAGIAGGRRLKAPPGSSTRPTSDAVREAIFNAVGSRMSLTGARVLDLFAGSGALGIEALSRGAADVTFVEKDRQALMTIAENLEIAGLGGMVVMNEAAGWLTSRPEGERWDLVLADPPYAYQEWSKLLAALQPHLAPEGIAVLETGGPLELPRTWRSVRSRRYGTTVVTLVVPCHHPCAESN